MKRIMKITSVCSAHQSFWKGNANALAIKATKVKFVTKYVIIVQYLAPILILNFRNAKILGK